uniref:Uncharacterized protein n=1 Tax=Nelumbo nucifera TaxID=4432 RepID=A0A822Y8B2_NELNU|nr:TPA_asm: hypothetical protein HUJ06_028913 [Nelumbo nucifera]
MVRRNGSCRRRRERMNEDGDLHAVIATVGADEVITFRLVKRDEVLAAAPVPDSSVSGAVVVIRLVHFEHIVLVLLVPKSCCDIKEENQNVRSEGGVLSGIARGGGGTYR